MIKTSIKSDPQKDSGYLISYKLSSHSKPEGPVIKVIKGIKSMNNLI